ncbi:hypothetical protein TELCIR_10319 [Teladorsagia circumcincta]|uniref:Uncharacterized protein n=1 Tax=Teladorsagia circumcincta TaxID=45464 RepID=A0A2G9UCF2_TELCI|nr:hypothetical protein TELCIR_10319 [Teladorsagia circumcincta]
MVFDRFCKKEVDIKTFARLVRDFDRSTSPKSGVFEVQVSFRCDKDPSELKMEGFRSLEEGERVGFYVRTRNSGQRAGALEAWEVCYGCGAADHLFTACPKVTHRAKSGGGHEGEDHKEAQEAHHALYRKLINTREAFFIR